LAQAKNIFYFAHHHLISSSVEVMVCVETLKAEAKQMREELSSHKAEAAQLRKELAAHKANQEMMRLLATRIDKTLMQTNIAVGSTTSVLYKLNAPLGPPSIYGWGDLAVETPPYVSQTIPSTPDQLRSCSQLHCCMQDLAAHFHQLTDVIETAGITPPPPPPRRPTQVVASTFIPPPRRMLC
jgi:hypothetical protein